MKVYAIFDRLAGTYGEPFLAKNNVLAERRFDYVLDNAPMVREDCDLYCLGSFNEESGFLGGQDKPEFVKRYERKVIS